MTMVAVTREYSSVVSEAASSEEWLAYFRRNLTELLPIQWDKQYRLTLAEVRTVASSIQQFQLGESSEGHHLMMLAYRFADRHHDPAFPIMMRIFIAEEQRHSATLATFLQREGLPLLEADPVDGIFRWIRHLTSLETAIMAMLTAEIIAVPYYTALKNSTRSPILKTICRQILRDESQHIRFQTNNLRRIRAGRALIPLWITLAAQAVLLAGTTLIVWTQHRKVLIAGGFGFPRFWRACFRWFDRINSAAAPIHPARSALPREVSA
jgi:hypothetical protein